MLKKPFVISVSAGAAGSGKTTIVGALKERLGKCAVLYFDEYGDAVDVGRDINEWAADGGDWDEWNFEPIVTDIERLLKEQHGYIVLDIPCGRRNALVEKYIDLAVCVDTPLDVALARRIIRDYTSRSQESEFGISDVSEVSLAGVDKELRWYLEHSRPTYVGAAERIIKTCDLVVDGMKAVKEIVGEIVVHMEMMVKK